MLKVKNTQPGQGVGERPGRQRELDQEGKEVWTLSEVMEEPVKGGEHMNEMIRFMFLERPGGQLQMITAT